MKAATTKRLDTIADEIQQLKNKKKVLLQKHKAEERRTRTHRLCKRGGYLESKIPALAEMTDEQFFNFVDNTVLPLFSETVK